jgi:NADH-quinone oxidoreductase subunit A
VSDPTVPGAPIWPLLVYFVMVVVLVALILGLSAVLGQRHYEPETGQPYESGIASTGSARVRVGAHFYLIAALFVIFDLESTFLIAWAISVRQTGWTGYVEVLVFAAVLLATLTYVWRVGALDVGAGRRRRPTRN